MTSKVALVIVSHSATLASGVIELAEQMAPNVAFFEAGGLAGGGIGTSLDKINSALDAALAGGRSAVILADLGSAVMTAETAIEFLDDPDLVKLVDAPLVEGAVAAAVAAEQGGSLDQVAAAAESANGGPSDAAEPSPVSGREVVIADAAGLHARPAAKLAAMAALYDAEITVDNADAQSVLGLMSLGKRQGDTVVVDATGPEADKAIREISDKIAAGFDN